MKIIAWNKSGSKSLWLFLEDPIDESTLNALTDELSEHGFYRSSVQYENPEWQDVDIVSSTSEELRETMQSINRIFESRGITYNLAVSKR